MRSYPGVKDERAHWDGEICDRCGRGYRLGYEVSDRIWNLVTGGGERCLCLDCFDYMAHLANVDCEIKVWWAGDATRIVKGD